MAAAGDAAADTPRRVLVTGGARGLGRAVVTDLAAAGYDVVFTYNASSDAAEELAGELGREHPGRSFETRQLDLSDRESVAGFVAALEDDAPYYGLVHNAGQSYDSLAAVMDQERAETAMQVNFWSLTRLVGGLVRRMTRAREGRIVLIGSVTAMRGSVGNAAYAASKAALMGYMRTLALETAKRGVTVNYVAPGFIESAMTEKLNEKQAEAIMGAIPMKRMGTGAEVASAVAYLASDEASYTTGQIHLVDGGFAL